MKYQDIHPDVAVFLKKRSIPENRLFSWHSDLYIGCTSHSEAAAILNGGSWSAMSSIFRPEKGSDMEMYPYGVDIAFAAPETKRMNQKLKA